MLLLIYLYDNPKCLYFAENATLITVIMTKKEKEVTRHYRLVHQIVSLTGINFQTKSIIG